MESYLVSNSISQPWNKFAVTYVYRDVQIEKPLKIDRYNLVGRYS